MAAQLFENYKHTPNTFCSYAAYFLNIKHNPPPPLHIIRFLYPISLDLLALDSGASMPTFFFILLPLTALWFHNIFSPVSRIHFRDTPYILLKINCANKTRYSAHHQWKYNFFFFTFRLVFNYLRPMSLEMYNNLN